MSAFWRTAWLVLRKDLAVEVRSRELLYTTVFFALACVLIFAVAFVREGKAPEEIPEVALPDGDPVHVPGLLAATFGMSTSEARRLIAQGGVSLDGEAVAELDLPRKRLEHAVLQAGKRRFARLTPA